jgi:predicted lysophospholipase L1 biosynthesis ABC-type transport system permease subunit
VILRLFVLKELRKNPFFFLLMTVTLILGTLGLISIGVVSEQVKQKLRENSQELLTSDFMVGARRPLLPEELRHLERVMEISTAL